MITKSRIAKNDVPIKPSGEKKALFAGLPPLAEDKRASGSALAISSVVKTDLNARVTSSPAKMTVKPSSFLGEALDCISVDNGGC